MNAARASSPCSVQENYFMKKQNYSITILELLKR